MALADIINRIEGDAEREARRIVREAEEAAARRASETLERARAQAERTRERIRRETEVEAATRVAAARLAARDEALRERRALVDEALAAVVASLEALPADEFACFLAAAILREARSGDVVSLAAADQPLRDTVRGIVEQGASDLELEWSEEAAPLERGALVAGGRTRAEITPRALVEARRGDLEVTIASELFGSGRA